MKRNLACVHDATACDHKTLFNATGFVNNCPAVELRKIIRRLQGYGSNIVFSSDFSARSSLVWRTQEDRNWGTSCLGETRPVGIGSFRLNKQDFSLFTQQHFVNWCGLVSILEQIVLGVTFSSSIYQSVFC